MTKIGKGLILLEFIKNSRNNILLCVLLIFPLLNWAQSPLFKNYTVKDGLPSSETFDVLQDRKGFIWIATDKGVSRYNGSRFENYTTKEGLADNSVLGLYEDESGRIWFRSNSGKLAYYKDGKINSLNDVNEELTKCLLGNPIISLLVQGDTLYIGSPGTLGKSVKIYLGSGNKQKIIFRQRNEAPGVYIKKLNKGIYYGFDGHYQGVDYKHYPLHWKNGDEIGEKFCFYKNEKLIKSSEIENSYSTNNVCYRVVQMSNGDYLFSYSNKIFILNSTTGKIIKEKKFPGARILSLLEDVKKGIWIGVYKKGLYYFPDGDMDKQPYHYLDSKSIGSVVQDREGGMWLTTLEKGVFYIQNYLVSNYFAAADLNCDKIQHFGLDLNQNIWANLDNGNVAVINHGQVSKINLNIIPDVINYIPHILMLNDGKMCVSGHLGCFVLNQQYKVEKKMSTVEGKSFGASCCLQTKKENAILLGVYHSLVKLKNNELTRYTFSDRIFSMDEDQGGQIWLACMNGLWKFKDEKFTYFGDQWPELKTRINDLKISEGNVIWMATKNEGLLIKHNNKILKINEANGLLSNVCSTVFLENEKSAWLSTNKGLSHIVIKSFSPLLFTTYNYSTHNGLLSNETSEVIVKNDSVYVLSNEGISVFNKTLLRANAVPPPVYISKLHINDSLVGVKDTFYLSYNQNNIVLNYIGLTYKDVENTLYKYRLKGLDTTWKCTKYTTANFTTLPYGNYTFEVYARNNDGYWSTAPARISFCIAPPFWHTWWFRILSLTALLSGIFLIIRYRIRVVEKRETEKTDLYKKAAENEKEKSELFQKAIDMELKFLSGQMNPHFTFNAMNSIQNFILDNNPLKANKYLTKYSRLIRLVLENNMQSTVPLSKEIEMLRLYAEMESMRFARKVDFDLSIAADLKDVDCKVPPMIIQPYIENSFWHGLRYKEEGEARISMHFSLESGSVKCVVEDNGVGREKAKAFTSKEKSHRSVGIFITEQRLKHLHTFSDKLVKTEIIDLVDAGGIACGTRAVLYLPVLEDKI